MVVEKRLSFYVLLLCFLSLKSFSQAPTDSIKKEKHNPEYVGIFKDKLSVAVLLCTRGTDVSIHDLSNRKKEARYAPNNIINYGFGINYKWLALELAFRVPFLDRQDNRRGDTKAFYLEARMIRRKYWFHGFLQANQGYYLANVKEFDAQWFSQNENFFFRSDIRTAIAYLAGNYIFNDKKFSYKAVSNQFEWQKRSAGSFILGGTLTDFNCNADSSLLPLDAKLSFSPKSEVSYINVLLGGVNLGYLHTFVIKKKFFVHLGLIQTVGIKSYTYTLEKTKQSETHRGFGYIIDGRFSTGYNNDRTFWGASFNFLNLNDSAGNQGLMDMNFLYFKLFFGKRLPYLPFMKKKSNAS